ncbi:hypothetical protein [Parabacteroides sp. AF14-59]|uniref:hypothetical protein n=1 Tax=Parabacteroides sp. AF14-59 TaxID=2292240 RepID=UPI000F003488|nr:hypothetical protein [Parabacteroides sp. AF14-59]RHR91251.1 hypothetical protein DWW23_25920 [Parabacteroides sp. AF14-59]
MRQKIGVILSCVGLTFLFGWWLWSAFHIQLNKLCSESSLVFADVLQREKTLQIEREFGNYNPKSSPNEISGAEKAEWCDQDFLFYRDSTRTLLDSLFRTTLLDRKIQANTAIRCVWNGRVINTSSDSTFYKEALPLRLLIYRIDENPDRNITLQAYIKLPFETVWRHSYLMWMISGLGLLLLGAIIGGYCFWHRKMHKITEQELLLQQQEQERLVLNQQQEQRRLELQRQQEKLQQQEQELLEKEKRLPIPEPLIQDKTIKWVELSKDLFFNEEHGDLCYRNDVNICLTENSLRLFCSFIKVEQHKLTYESICIDVLSRSIKNGLSKTDRDAVANAIRHLRIHLKQIPVIEIEPLRGIGYQMIILNP